MKVVLAAGLYSLKAVGLTVAAVPQAADANALQLTVEKNTDRPGGDYRNIRMDAAHPDACREACRTDRRCRAYSYVAPGHQGPTARCWLKYRVPTKRSCSWCESGVKKQAR